MKVSYKRSVLILFVFLFLYAPSSAYGQEYSVSYQTIYNLLTNGDATVELNVQLDNKKKSTYIKEFSFYFPGDIEINNTRTKSNLYQIIESNRDSNGQHKITVGFSHDLIDNNNILSFAVLFDQKKIVKKTGNIFELSIPIIYDRNQTDNVIHLKNINWLPPLSVSKPQPQYLDSSEIRWTNIDQKFLYAVFGNKQYYKITTVYNLFNNQLGSQSQEIALPPDTEYQSVLLQSIDPKPSAVNTDVDGNVLATYVLKPSSKLSVKYEGYAVLSTESDPEYQAYMKNQFQTQKKYLLKNQEYWQFYDDKQLMKKFGLTNPETIYQYILKNFEYDYKRVKTPVIRRGAWDAIKTPESSLCTEYTDTFIAISRKAGIYSREIQGFGFSNDDKLRPLSLVSDILHSWPEYYVESQSKWHPIDPTWQSTSGLNYYSSFDLNHIALVIHGKSSKMPKAAGTYKIERSKDLIVLPISEIPQPQKIVEINHDLKRNLKANKKYTLNLDIRNNGNVIIKNKILTFKSSNLNFNPSQITINYLAPMERESFRVVYQSDALLNTDDNLQIIFDNQLLQENKINIRRMSLRPLIIMTGGILVIIISLAFIIYKKSFI